MTDGLPTHLLPGLAALAGALFGSFAHLVIVRWPEGLPLGYPPPACPGCRLRPAVWRRIPVLGWLLVRGRCRRCGAAVGPGAPAVELGCAGAAAGVVWAIGSGWQALAAAALVVVLVPVVVIDLRHRLIPDLLVVPATALALVAAILADPSRWWLPVAGCLGAAGFLALLWVIHPEGMGLGDVKLAGLIGAALGASAIPALMIAFALGAALGVVLVLRMGLRARRVAVPFGPPLAAGALVALWAGPAMLDWCVGRL